MDVNEFIQPKELTDDDVDFVGQKFSYAKYMCLVKIPMAFARLIVPAIIISIILFLGKRIGFFRGRAYVISHIIGLVLYWIFILIKFRNSIIDTHTLKHYYISCIFSYFLFVMISMSFILIPNGIRGILSITDSLYIVVFRIALVPAIIDDGIISLTELVYSLFIFYSSVLAIIFITPMFVVLTQKEEF